MSANSSDRHDDRWEWTTNIGVSDEAGGFAYVKNRVILPAGHRGLLASIVKVDAVGPVGESFPLDRFDIATGSFDVIQIVALLRALGVAAQPDHVFGAHGCECCGPHPADILANPVRANPVRANPVRANAASPNPVRANSASTNPVRANPVRANFGVAAVAHSSAEPAPPPPLPLSTTSPTRPRITVLDTGLAGVAGGVDQRPGFLRTTATGTPKPITGDADDPDADGDQWLDPVAGHGTFIAGVIERLAPGCPILVRQVVHGSGVGVESDIVQAIAEEAGKQNDRPEFLNLSFGGPVWTNAPLLAATVAYAQVRNIVVVASAGNDGWCAPVLPAALPEVVSVGAIGPEGPAWFTNYGSWVRACAPGVDIVSSFFAAYDGKDAPAGGQDPDDFRGWARWSGTSFSAPAVIAALVREMRLSGCTNTEAVTRVIDSPWLGRQPGLGTIVNV